MPTKAPTNKESERYDCTNCPKNEDLKIYDESFLPHFTCLDCLEKGRPAKPRRKGNRLPKGSVEKEIIEYLLDQHSGIGESEIKEHLKFKLGTSDSKNLKKHLERLNAIKCISGYKNIKYSKDKRRWYINDIVQLKNIKKEFPEIILEDKIKASEIVSRERAFKEGYLNYDRLKTFLQSSGTFFDIFLYNPIEEILKKAKRLYFFSYDSDFKIDDNRIISEYPVTMRLIVLNLLHYCILSDIGLKSLTSQKESKKQSEKLKLIGEMRLSRRNNPQYWKDNTPEELKLLLDYEGVISYDEEDFEYISKNRRLITVLGLMKERVIA